MSARGGDLGRAVLRLLARTLPAHVRARYREEWLADLAGAQELDLSRGSILLGALATAVSMDRDDPVVLGVPVSVEAVRRARWAAAFLGSAGLLAVGLWWNGGYAMEENPLSPVLEWVGQTLGILAAVFAAVGTWQLLRALFVGVDAFGLTRVLLLGLAGLGCMLGLGLVLLSPFVGLLYGFMGLVVGLVLAAGGPRGAIPTAPLAPMRRVLLALPFAVGALLMLGVVLMHVFVWNPLAKLPGMTLDEIYAVMGSAGGSSSGGEVSVAAVVVCGLLLLAPPVLAATPALAGPRSTRRIVLLGLLSISVTGGLSFFLGFGMGMGIADDFGTDGGDAAASGPLISILAQLVLVVAVFVGFAPASRRRLAAPAGSASLVG